MKLPELWSHGFERQRSGLAPIRKFFENRIEFEFPRTRAALLYPIERSSWPLQSLKWENLYVSLCKQLWALIIGNFHGILEKVQLICPTVNSLHLTCCIKIVQFWKKSSKSPKICIYSNENGCWPLISATFLPHFTPTARGGEGNKRERERERGGLPPSPKKEPYRARGDIMSLSMRRCAIIFKSLRLPVEKTPASNIYFVRGVWIAEDRRCHRERGKREAIMQARAPGAGCSDQLFS